MSNSTSGGLTSGWADVPPDFRRGEGNQEHYPWYTDYPLPYPAEGDDAPRGTS